jgi:hypothetical protein
MPFTTYHVEYYAEPRLPQEVYNRVEERLDDILLLLRSTSDVGTSSGLS